MNLRSAWLRETVPQKRKSPFVQVFVQILVIVFHLDSSYSQLRRGNLPWENASIWLAYRHACGTFSWLTIDEGGPSPLWALPPLGMWYWVYKKVKCTSHEEQASEQPVPWPLPQFQLQIPALSSVLTFVHGLCLSLVYKPKNLFPSQFAFFFREQGGSWSLSQ